ncbi:MAG: tRNA (adenosine(37)-N6)-threonylcarbamoyltransferase complex transferase subunit TsaD [Puniceicoccales bacterium]|nr:tRNA (adenosine(37)-N6)-threonylcarbamoyltransferase complex transferase subunit TsaD [Puniceicoccales bacterium]
MKILSLESSCDDSSLAFLDTERRIFPFEKNHSQALLHREYGGVFPNLAAREHGRVFPELIAAWESCACGPPDRIAVTRGPGLPGCLAVGLGVAQSLARRHGCDLLGVNHLRAHALSPFLPLWQQNVPIEPLLPHLGLLVSGGNTLLFIVGEDFQFQLLARTLDDAAGEALDKGARMLGLPYPGGVEIERLAANGDPAAFAFPRAFRGRDLKFSFSGLKTSLLYRLKKMSSAEIDERRANLCASYQEAVCDALLDKVDYAIRNFFCRSLGLSGGVSQNGRLRKKITQIAAAAELSLLLAPEKYCGDNASMVAFAAAVDPMVIAAPVAFDPNLKIYE